MADLTGPQLQMLRDAAADFDGERTFRVRGAGGGKVARRLEELGLGRYWPPTRRGSRFNLERSPGQFVINEDGIEEVDAHAANPASTTRGAAK